MEEISGVVERITYADENAGFSVIKIRSRGYSELVTLVGNIASVSIGAVVNAQGNWSINPKFGRQFNVQKWEEKLPASIYGIEKYLGSGLIKGLGPKFAKIIVNTFGEKTLEIIENDPLRLSEIPKIGRKRVLDIAKAWREQKDIKNLMIFLQEHDVSTNFGHKIYKIYGEKSIEKVTKNPYALADDIYGIGFVTADTIAMKMGMDKESYSRCRAGIFYILNHFANNEGHCYLPFEALIKSASEMLEIEESKLVMTFSHLIFEKELIRENTDEIYLPAFYHSEIGLANRVKNIMKSTLKNKISSVEKLIEKLEKINKIFYDDIQKDAIKTAVNSKFSIITGGPGVGKSTITKAIIEIFKNQKMKVLLAAPTGRAAKRMAEICGIEAKTIHRLLEFSPKEGSKRNAENPLFGDVLIVDEASMLDLMLAYNLTKAIPDEMRVILIGDVDQLPSVGPGNVLSDLISSEKIPVVKLTKIYRQAQQSKIITNAHAINSGNTPNLLSERASDFFFIEEENSEKIVNLISDLCAKRLPNSYKIDPLKYVQVLAPMKRGETGTDNLNRVLQNALNFSNLALKKGGTEFRKGDKVMQIKNNYDKNIFNGDIGFVTNIDVFDKKLTVNFDEKLVDYDILELDELVLSYAITIHKSQGAEFPIVIMPLTFKHRVMLQRNLLYTGVTRARKMLILIGEKSAVEFAVKNDEAQKRFTSLDERLR